MSRRSFMPIDTDWTHNLVDALSVKILTFIQTEEPEMYGSMIAPKVIGWLSFIQKTLDAQGLQLAPKPKKTAKITLQFVKDDGWSELCGTLGLPPEKVKAHFEYEEFAFFELEVDEKLQIVGGHFNPVPKKR